MMIFRDQKLEYPLPCKVEPSMAELFSASLYATDTDSDVWDFAVSIGRLKELGASETDLRWLVKKGYVQHGREITLEGDDGRQFRPTGNLNFSHHTCFVISSIGLQIARSVDLSCPSEISSVRGRHPLVTEAAGPMGPHHDGRPDWNSELRKLWLNGQLIKRFKWPAVNQEAVLCAFQEENWPERIDDPLTPQPEQDPKRRLADTIKCLNRKQSLRLVHFRGDGTGEGVIWERV
ncbi:hypothetical protein NHH03_18940 [Stieleria sp. TO1_6]|uniref:hypothetical protein n=1 Tax=Stieleria tagensis TaxID=2956795 RepID=UPI00209A8B55|nr:hypothetical protein [Stieleria tagensis]MCO8123829.1 hypothetical protein [Stieleria tagensis]